MLSCTIVNYCRLLRYLIYCDVVHQGAQCNSKKGPALRIDRFSRSSWTRGSVALRTSPLNWGTYITLLVYAKRPLNWATYMSAERGESSWLLRSKYVFNCLKRASFVTLIKSHIEIRTFFVWVVKSAFGISFFQNNCKNIFWYTITHTHRMRMVMEYQNRLYVMHDN